MRNNRFIGGISATFGAYGLWGMLPVYWKQLKNIPADEIIAHRIIWSLAFMLLIMIARGTLSNAKKVFQGWRACVGIILSSILITANWTIYIWAVNSGHILDTSMGYYINPIMSVLLGALILGERLGWEGLTALTLAILGVGLMLFKSGDIPWIALLLAITFAFYGLLKKKLPIGAEEGLFLETLVASPFAIAYLFYLNAFTSRGATVNADGNTIILLLLVGIVTAAPLLLFGIGVRLTDLAIVGFIQYVSPTITLILGLCVYHEQLSEEKLAAFGLIWLGLVIFTATRAVRHIRPRLESEIEEPI